MRKRQFPFCKYYGIMYAERDNAIEPPICFAVRFSAFGAFAVDFIRAPNVIYRFFTVKCYCN